jgi:hypothetical protein
MMNRLSTSSYMMKTYAGLTYVVVFWALGLAVQHYQSGVLRWKRKPEEDGLSVMNPSFWDNFGLSCISNVLMGCLYLVVYMGDIAFRKFYHLRGRSGASSCSEPQSQPPPACSDAGVFCVEDEEEPSAAPKEPPPQPRPHAVGIELPCDVQAAEEEGVLLLRITPGRLWYYMYTTGWGVFCMAYTLHGAHWVSSMCLCAGSLCCAVWGALRERQVNSARKRMAMAFLVVLNVMSLCMCTSLLFRQSSLLWRSWVVEIACPLLTPFWLWESKDKMLPVNMHKQSLVMFGLPFTSMISAGYLSMCIPLQECVSALGISYDDNKNKNGSLVTNTTIASSSSSSSSSMLWTPLVTEESLMGQSAWGLLLCGVIVPALLYMSFVVYASGFQKVDMQMLCANSLWTVLAMRLWMYAGTFGSVACMALLGWFVALVFVLLHHLETDRIREWRDVYGDILLSDECVDTNPQMAARC